MDVVGAALCALGLGGPTFALIQQPLYGWSDPMVLVPLVGGVATFAAFLAYEARAPAPMLPLGLFRRRNFAVGNVETFSMYAGLSLLFFFLVLFLQQVAGYTALEAGTASIPVTVVMFLLSSRFGALADRMGPRIFMGAGPLIAAAGFALLLRLDREVSYLVDLLPALLLFALGLSMTVAPLTSSVLSGADERNAGLASGVNNAIARVAGLFGVSAVGALVAWQFGVTLDERLAGREMSPAGRTAVAEARRQPLARSPSRGSRGRRPGPSAWPWTTPRSRAFASRWGRGRRWSRSEGCSGRSACATPSGGGCPRASARAASSWPRRPTPRGPARFTPEAT